MSTIGRYRIESEIGRGTMGVVYLAHDPRLSRRVAVKTVSLPQGLGEAERREFHERFHREARAAAALSHPGIVTVYDADDDAGSGIPFIAMEYVEGRTLADEFVLRERLEPRRVLALGKTLAEAVHAAHLEGIVHRDLKPANVLVRAADGAVKIADFGVARLSSSELTRSGTSLGSPGYMSPEQIQGRPVDGRSDLFSLAVMLYECLCGERPFAGDDMASLAWSIVHEAPAPISSRVPGLPPMLDAFFDRALAKDPARRYADGAALAAALDAAFRAKAPEATVVDRAAAATVAKSSARVPRRAGAARAWWAGSVLAGLALVLGVWASSGGSPGEGAWLRLDARSSFPEGRLTVLVDGRRVYSRKLETGSGKTVTMLKKVIGKGEETFETLIEVDPGRHEVLARVVTDDKRSGWEDSVVVELKPGETGRLRLAAGRTFGAPVSLRAD